MESLHFYLLMFCGGLAIAIQPSINGRLATRIGDLESSCVSFAVGTLGLLFLVLCTGRAGNLRGIVDARWWELTGGFLGALFVTLTIVIVPRIGTASAMAATITAQLMAGVILDHYGLFGFRTVPIDGKRLFGVFLLMAGAGLVFRR